MLELNFRHARLRYQLSRCPWRYDFNSRSSQVWVGEWWMGYSCKPTWYHKGSSFFVVFNDHVELVLRFNSRYLNMLHYFSRATHPISAQSYLPWIILTPPSPPLLTALGTRHRFAQRSLLANTPSTDITTRQINRRCIGLPWVFNLNHARHS